jgi:hypothetical protein
MQKNILLLMTIIFFTDSMDRVCNLVVGGFNIRFAYVIILLLGLLTLLTIAKKHGRMQKKYFSGGLWLVFWTITLLVFIPNTTYLMRNIGYMLWHLLHVTLIVFMLLLITNHETFQKAVRIYLWSFAILSAFGLIQLFFGLFGISVLVTDWWIPGRFPRINGFCYEPSYFGTYLLIGWASLFILRVVKNDIFPKRQLNGLFIIVTLGTLVTSSRMSYLLMIAVVVFYTSYLLVTSLWKMKITRKTIVYFLILTLSCVAIGALISKNLDSIKFMFSGVGLAGTSSHSVKQRSGETEETFDIFKRSPWIGVSLGGIPSARALQKGIIVTDNITAKNNEGLNIFVEVLAASGIIGALFFLAYWTTIFGTSLSLYRKVKRIDNDLSVLLLAFPFGLLCELGILIMNQNISRLYLWVHIGMVMLVISNGAKVVAQNKIKGQYS